MNYPTEIRIPSAPDDEVGTPDGMIQRCDLHDVLYRRGDVCLDCLREPEQ